MRRALLWIPLLLSAAGAVELPLALRGPRGVFLLAGEQPLTITLTKRDMNLYEGADTLSASLLGPTRRELASATLPDDGEAGKGTWSKLVQEATLTAPAAGVCRLMLTGSDDCIWGLQTNARGCVVEGEVFFNDPAAKPAKLFFAPPPGKFTVIATAPHQPGLQQLPLLDAAGQTVATFDLSDPAKKEPELLGPRSTGGYTAGQKLDLAATTGDRKGLWCFDIQHTDLHLRMPAVRYWTTDQAAWFDPARTRGMLTPYSATRYLERVAQTPLEFHLRNTTGVTDQFTWGVLDEHQPQRPLDPGPTITLAPGAEKTFSVAPLGVVPPPAGVDMFRLTVVARSLTDPTVVATAEIVARYGEAPWRKPLTGPIVLKPYQHENALYGYAPEFFPNETYFDPQNHPVFRQRSEDRNQSTGVMVLQNGQMVLRSSEDALRAIWPDYAGAVSGGGFLGAKVAFDGRGGLYTLLKVRRKSGPNPDALLFSPDQGKTWQVLPFEGVGFDLEQFTGHNALDAPPPLLAYVLKKPHPAPYCGYHDLLLYLPRRDGDTLTLGEPIKVAENCVGSCEHSGGPASTVTRAGKTHIVWGEVAPDDAPGVPEYVATYDHATGKLGPKVLLGYAPPVNDVHNVPAITIDSGGTLHILLGAHGEQFQYLRSLRPNDAGAFTRPEPILTAGYVDAKTGPQGAGRQTYISLVCGPDDTLHTAYRQWRRGVDAYHPGGYYAALSYQRKPKNGPWSEAKPLVIPPLPNYSIYYHKLTLDRRGRLYLVHSYFTETEAYQNDFPGLYHDSALLTSADGGTTWKLAGVDDFR